MIFNEDSRVKIPALLHLTRLGYTYVSLRNLEWETSCNLVPKLFVEAVSRLNPEAGPAEIDAAVSELSLLLENEDLGKRFYERLIARSGLKLIDFDDFRRNSLHVVTEFPCRNEDEEFRPDITLLINGLPLVFIEVKKPNNRDGILAERRRIESRFQNKKFRRFVNATQLMVFSNNMERMPAGVPLQHALPLRAFAPKAPNGRTSCPKTKKGPRTEKTKTVLRFGSSLRESFGSSLKIERRKRTRFETEKGDREVSLFFLPDQAIGPAGGLC